MEKFSFEISWIFLKLRNNRLKTVDDFQKIFGDI